MYQLCSNISGQIFPDGPYVMQLIGSLQTGSNLSFHVHRRVHHDTQVSSHVHRQNFNRAVVAQLCKKSSRPRMDDHSILDDHHRITLAKVEPDSSSQTSESYWPRCCAAESALKQMVATHIINLCNK